MKKTLIVIAAFLISLEGLAQKRIESMNNDQLNTYKNNAVKLRNAGRGATLFGLGFFLAGGTTALVMAGRDSFGMETVPLIVGAGIMAPCALVGVPLWATGASRKKRAEIRIQNFNYKPDNPQAFGLKLTITL